MGQLHYEYEIFDNLILGELSPFSNNEIDQNRIPTYMLETVGKCENIVIGKFKKKRNKYILHKKQELTNAHPLANNYFSQVHIASNQLEEGMVPENILKDLDVPKEKVINVSVKQTDAYKVVILGVESDWAFIDKNRLNYCYINKLLEKEVASIKRNIKKKLFPLKDDAIKQFIHRSQHTLLNFATDIAVENSITANDTVLNIKADYTDKDCMILAHSYIVDLISFLEREFKTYLNEDLQIPYQSDLLKKNGFIQKAKTISRLLKKIQANDELIKIINEPLCKVLNLTSEKRITYHEFKYYQIFLTGLERELAVNKNIVQDQIIRFLFQVEFNPIKLTSFIVNQLIETLEQLPNDKSKMLFLIERQKCIKQLTKISKEKYKKSNQPLDISVLNWITNEIKFLKFKSTTQNLSQNFSQTIVSNYEKIVVNTNVGVLALLSKLLFELEIVQAKGIQDLCRLISLHIKTENLDVLSEKNLKNSMYEPSQNNIDELKSKLIAMVNLLNKQKE
jgi:hypothetical protein